MEQGWIYVLVNSSIPGLVKVGRTTRPPKERAAELSAATGVATPFVIAFEQEFADCVSAEENVHAELDRRGLRIAANREFFRGSPAEIVRVVLQVASDSGAGPAWQPVPSAAEMLAEGDRHRLGSGEMLQDMSEAARCYRLAMTRGSLIAVERLAVIYSQIRTPRRANRRRAMRYLKDGAKRGNYFCYCEMARLYAEEGHIENFTKAWDLFFARRVDSFLEEAEGDAERYPAALHSYIAACLDLGVAPGHLPELRESGELLMQGTMGAMDLMHDAPETRARLAAVLRWSYLNLTPQPAMPLRPRRGWLARWSGVSHRVPA